MIVTVALVCCRQVEIPGTGYIDFASAPNPTAKKPDAKIFSMEEMTQIQQLLKEMEDTKDDPFKQLALSAKLRILQEKQAAAMAKTATTQAEALKKLEGVMSEEEMSELKKALYKIQAKKQMNKEGAKDEDRKGDDKRKKGDKMPPWRAPKGSKEVRDICDYICDLCVCVCVCGGGGGVCLPVRVCVRLDADFSVSFSCVQIAEGTLPSNARRRGPFACST